MWVKPAPRRVFSDRPVLCPKTPGLFDPPVPTTGSLPTRRAFLSRIERSCLRDLSGLAWELHGEPQCTAFPTNVFDEDDDSNEIAEQILRYLQKHPKAADSVDGITRWWLRRQRFEESVERVQKVLDRLVSEDLIFRSVSKSGVVIYSRSDTTKKQYH